MMEIRERKDVAKLVYAFYDKIRVDEYLGPIFDMHLDETTWPPHLEKLVDFWESNLLGARNFKGNPAKAHGVVDYNLSFGIVPEHFEHWVKLWHETVNELFQGELAEKAKAASLGMANGIYRAVLHQRGLHQQY